MDYEYLAQWNDIRVKRYADFTRVLNDAGYKSPVLNAKFVDAVPDVLRRSMLDEWNKYCFNDAMATEEAYRIFKDYEKEKNNMINVKIGDLVRIKCRIPEIDGKIGTVVRFNSEWSTPYAVKIEGCPNPYSEKGVWYLKENEFHVIKKDTKKELNKFFVPSIYPWNLTISNVKFNPPATIVFWADGTKTVVKSNGSDIYDPEKGLAMAIVKKALGNKGNYYNVFKKWIDENANFTDPLKSEIADDN